MASGEGRRAPPVGPERVDVRQKRFGHARAERARAPRCAREEAVEAGERAGPRRLRGRDKPRGRRAGVGGGGGEGKEVVFEEEQPRAPPRRPPDHLPARPERRRRAQRPARGGRAAGHLLRPRGVQQQVPVPVPRLPAPALSAPPAGGGGVGRGGGLARRAPSGA